MQCITELAGATEGDVRSNSYFINGSHLLTGALRLDAGLLRIINTDRGRGVNPLGAMAGIRHAF
ncbi:hypothetical protein RSP795_16890 [Ralstonia solanacearum]|nr:hypothetical protein RSP795_16890 [Ralstonia solanacearum]